MFSLKRKKSLSKIRKKSNSDYDIFVYRSGKHSSLSLYDVKKKIVIISCCTKDKNIAARLDKENINTSSVKAAFMVGEHLAGIVSSKIGNQKISFNRSCYPYTGRARALHEGFVSKYK